MVELFSQSRYSKKMRARKGAAGGEPEGYAGRKITLIFLMFKKNIGNCYSVVQVIIVRGFFFLFFFFFYLIVLFSFCTQIFLFTCCEVAENDNFRQWLQNSCFFARKQIAGAGFDWSEQSKPLCAVFCIF